MSFTFSVTLNYSFIKVFPIHIIKTPNVRSGKKQQAFAIPWQAA